MIRKYETYMLTKDKKCWKIPSRYLDEFGAALMYIGMSEEEILFWINERYLHLNQYNYVTMFYDGTLWSWSSAEPSDSENYQGKVTISQKDIDEWELFIATKKYNL